MGKSWRRVSINKYLIISQKRLNCRMQPGQVWGLTLLPSQGRMWTIRNLLLSKQELSPLQTTCSLLLQLKGKQSTDYFTVSLLISSLLSHFLICLTQNPKSNASATHNDRKKPYDPLSFNNSLVNIAILDESNFLPSLTLHLVLGTARVKLHNQEDWYCPDSQELTSTRLSTLSGGSILVSSQYSVPISIEGNIFPPSSFKQVFFKNSSCWRIVDLQCCISFWRIAKWFTYTYAASQVARVVKNLPVNAGDIRDKDSVPGWGRCPGGGHGSPLQYSCLENPMDRGAWHATVRRATKSWTRPKRLNTTIPNSQSILLPPSWKPQVCLLCLWVCFCFIHKFSVSCFRFHI